MSSLSFKNPISENATVKPVKLRLGVASYDTPTWAKVLEMAARAMLDSVRTRKAALDAVKRFSWMAHSSSGMARPCKLEKNLWIELHQGSHGILVRTKMLLEACGYPLDQASLECSESTDKSAKSGKDAPSAPPPSAVGTPSKPPTSHPQSKSIFPAKATLAEPVQPTLFGPSSPEQPSLFAASRDTGKSHRGKAKEPYTAYPKRELFAALAEDRIPDEDFNGLLTLAGTRALLGMTPRHNTPVFSLLPQRFFWRDAAIRRGQSVFVTAQWFERDKARLDKMLARWRGSSSKSEKIGAYAKRMLFQALAEKGRIPDEDFTELQSLEGTKALLGISLTTCPLFSLSPMVRRDGGRGSWIDPATHDGRPVYVNSQWYEEYRPKLDRLLARWPKKGSDDPVTNNDDEWIPLVLEVAFPNGFQPGNFIDAQRFKAAWRRELKEPWPYQSDAAFDRVVRAASVSAEGRLFAPASLLPEDIAKKLARDILSRFANGARSVRFPPLFNEWKDRLEGSRVYDPAALRAVVKWLLRDRKELVFKGLAVTNDPDWFDNPIPEVERVLDEHGTLMSVDELCRELPDFSEDDLVHACRDSSSIILAKPRHYIAVSAISFDTEADRAARDWLDREFRRAVHVPVRALAEAVRSASPSFADTTDGFTTDAYSMFFRSAIGDAFDVTSFVVARKGEGADIRDVAKSWLAEKDAFNLDDFLSLVDSFGAMAALYPQMAAFFVDFIRIDASHFVRKDGLRFPVADIDRVLAGATADGGLPISDENVRHLLPPAPDHLTWTPWLLADYADKVSTGFRFLSGSTSQREALGAIVPAASPFRRYEDILPGVLARALTVNLADARGSILWLYENGWIPQRRFRDIDRVLGVARSLRAQKKGSL